MGLRFEWDPDKASQNVRKHGVSFAEAEGVFADPLALEVPDPGHSDDEPRWIAIGRSYQGRVLVVAFSEREGATRLISARSATRSEVKRYEEEQ